ncbi:MAG: hypothetical protein LKJ49_00070 [Olsenella sp.]|jgi:hypothetical protein|nr:hypothetical protein [Olsenella sp.]
MQRESRTLSNRYDSPQAEVVEVAGAAMCASGASSDVGIQISGPGGDDKSGIVDQTGDDVHGGLDFYTYC